MDTKPALITVECARLGQAYTLIEAGPVLDVHLAGPGARGGTGPCICGYDRFGHGFSVGGGTTGPGVHHEICPDCARLSVGAPISGLHAEMFAEADYVACSGCGLRNHDTRDRFWNCPDYPKCRANVPW